MGDLAHWFDWGALAVAAGVAFRGYQRGFIAQLSTLLAVGLGLLGGLHLQDAALPLLPDSGHPELQFAVSFALVFAVIALSVNVVARLLRQVVHALFLGWIDRFLGGCFGLLIAVQLLLVAVLLVSRYLPEGVELLQQTRVAPQLFVLIEQILPLLPSQFTEFFEQHYGELLS